MPVVFWVDCAAYAVTAVIAIVLGLMVLVTRPKCTLNHLFALFALAEATRAIAALLVRMMLRLQAGNPALMLELLILAFAVAEPVLLMFAVRYVGRRSRWADLAAILGLAGLVAMSVPLFRHQLVSNPHWVSGQASLYYDVDTWGLVSAAGPAVYMVWTAILFWRDRRRTHEAYMAAGPLVMLAGFTVGGLLQPHFSVSPFTTTFGILVLSHGMLDRQLISPLRKLNTELEHKVDERTHELEAERNFVSTVLNTAGALVVVLDAQGRIVRFNRTCEQVTGYSFDEVRGRHLWDLLLTPEDAASARVGFEHPQRGDFPSKRESYCLTRNGERRLIAWSNSVLLDDQGSVEHVIGTGIDVTERVRAEEALKHSEEKYRLLADNTVDCIWLMDMDLVFTYVNPAIHRMTGYTPEEWVGTRLSDHCDADNLGTMVGKVRQAISKLTDNSGITFETAVLSKDGVQIPVEITGKVLLDEQGRPVGLQGVTRDTSERVRIDRIRSQAEKALKERAAQLALINDVGQQIAAVSDLESVLERTVQLVQETFGYHHVFLFTVDRERGEVVDAAMAGAYTALFPSGIRQALSEGIIGWVARHGETLLTNDVNADPRYADPLAESSRIVTQSELAVPIRLGEETAGVLDVQSPRVNAFDENDVMTLETLAAQIAVAIENARLYGALQRELMNRRQAEEKLSFESGLLRSLLGHLPISVYFKDTEGRLLRVSDHYIRQRGAPSVASVDQIVGKTDLDLYPEELARKTIQDDRRVMETREPVEDKEERSITPEGDAIYLQTTKAPMIDDAGNVTGIVGFTRDITERKRADERLQHYAAELEQANEEIKQFAYIVSHDMRAPLVNLKGFAAELRAALAVVGASLIETLPHLDEKQQRGVTLALQEDVPEALEFIDAAVSRMDAFINAVLKLSRLGRRELKLDPLHTEALVQASLQTLAHQLKGCQVTVGALPDVIADRTSMEQVWDNLLGNAVKYLDPNRPGVIEITAQRADVVSGDDEATFHVRDNGRGIAPEDMHKVFTPFRRAGTQDVPGEGMGLAYVQTLLRRHGGRIWCESEPGVGTTFSFTIPGHRGESTGTDNGEEDMEQHVGSNRCTRRHS